MRRRIRDRYGSLSLSLKNKMRIFWSDPIYYHFFVNSRSPYAWAHFKPLGKNQNKINSRSPNPLEKIKIRSNRFLFDFSITKMYLMISIDNQNASIFHLFLNIQVHWWPSISKEIAAKVFVFLKSIDMGFYGWNNNSSDVRFGTSNYKNVWQ